MDEGDKRLTGALLNGNVSKILEITRSQRKSQREVMLPKNMRPEREAFETVGFIFEDIGDDVLYKTTLPIGWSWKGDGVYSFEFFDENGNHRGTSSYFDSNERRFGMMRLYTRFCVNWREIKPGDENSPVEIFAEDLINNRIIFVASEHVMDMFSIDTEKCEAEVKSWLSTNYPDWENVIAYWE